MPHTPTRRTFIRSLATAGATLPAVAPRLVRAVSPNGKLRFAGIGIGGMAGIADVTRIAQHPNVELVALCDIDPRTFAKAIQHVGEAPRYTDYRALFDELGERIDIVNVSVPDHMHAPIAMRAMDLGVHVYCEKPMSRTVWEARQMAELAARKRLITRMGNQIHSRLEYRLACRMLRDGVIGKVKQVHAWVNSSGWQWVKADAPAGREDPTPDGFDWDLWLGPAPLRPYVHGAYHPTNWRAWKDFGGGGLGDFGCHILDVPFTALELTAPTTVIGDQQGMTDQRWPRASTVTWTFPGTALTEGESLAVTWYDGGRRPDPALLADMPDGQRLPPHGSIFVGTQGQMLLPHVGGPRVFPVELHREYNKTRPDLGTRHHWHDWVDAVAAGDASLSDQFAYAGPLTETVNLGLIATEHPGQMLHWDASRLTITNHARAHARVSREYRAGHEIIAH